MRLERMESLLNKLISNSLSRFVASDDGDCDGDGSTSSPKKQVRAPSTTSDPQGGYGWWTWEGKIRPMPSDYKYPKKTSLKNIHDLWYQGVPALNIRPFKFIKGILWNDKLAAQSQSRAGSLITEIDSYLPENYSALSCSEKDNAFIVAFGQMTANFILGNGQHKKADHTMSYTTLYEKHYVPFNKKRKLGHLVVN